MAPRNTRYCGMNDKSESLSMYECQRERDLVYLVYTWYEIISIARKTGGKDELSYGMYY